MKYKFRPLPELYWGVLIAGVLVILQTLLTLDPTEVVDWKVWALGLAGAAVRPMAGAAIDYIRRSMMDEPEPTLADRIMELSVEERDALTEELLRRSGLREET